jgi:hypothetical protein
MLPKLQVAESAKKKQARRNAKIVVLLSGFWE